MKLRQKEVRLLFGLLLITNVLLLVGAGAGVAALGFNRDKTSDETSAQMKRLKDGAVQMCSAVGLFGLGNLVFSVPLALHFWKQTGVSAQP